MVPPGNKLDRIGSTGFVHGNALWCLTRREGRAEQRYTRLQPRLFGVKKNATEVARTAF
jgi:hypothetical protein